MMIVLPVVLANKSRTEGSSAILNIVQIHMNRVTQDELIMLFQ